MKHIDLFSGIGGFALATEMVWNNVEHIFCDNDPFAQQILKKHWPNAPIYGDIRSLTADAERERQLQQKGYKQKVGQRTCDLLTGGFPCQPFSQAGRRRGTSDDRYLWPEMLRVIREFAPKWVVAENVGGLVTWDNGMVFEAVCTDLEKEGYEVQSFIIPACGVDAPHRRDRVWIVAHSIGSRLQRTRSKTSGRSRFSDRTWSNKRPNWGKNWLEIATRLCRVDDGIPRRLDRTPRLKALGNAIVPQVAEQIMRAIKVSSYPQIPAR